MFKYKVTELTFSGGETIDVGDADVVILVGANSCGKSQTLRDIGGHIGLDASNRQLRVIHNIGIESEGFSDAFREWFEKNVHVENSVRGKSYLYFQDGKIGFTLPNSDLEAFIKVGHYSPFAPLIVRELSASERLNLTLPAKRISVFGEPPTHDIHYLQQSDEKFDEIRYEISKSFGTDLILDYGGGQTISIRVGEEPQRNEDSDRVSSSYLQALSKLPTLDQEGDGLRSFVACLIVLKTTPHKIISIDEPEIFLHPPQAKRIGELLADSSVNNNQQILIATHSAEIIQGILNTNARTTFVRINRNGDKNHAFALSGNEISELWNKPMLKSLRAINGLFHEGVIVCESDADTAFYEALLSRLKTRKVVDKPADFYFVHSRGSGELATLAGSYISLNIPTAVIADFDILKDSGEIKKIIKSLGHDFSKYEDMYFRVRKSLENLGNDSTSITDAVTEIRRIVNKIEAAKRVSNSDRNKIQTELENNQSWSEAKKHGINALTGEQQFKNCETLLSQFEDIGFFIVPVGELECWKRSLGISNKPKWIQKALPLISKDPASFEKASKFIKHIAHYLWQASS